MAKRHQEAVKRAISIVDHERARLWLGDCLAALKEMPAGHVDLVVADLPYGTTACAWDSIIPLDKLWAELNRVCKLNAAMVFTAQQPFTWKLCASNPEALRHELIWSKPNGTNPFQAKTMPMKKHENILVFSRGRHTYNPQMVEGSPYKWNSKRTKGEAGGVRQEKETPIDNKGIRFPGSVLHVKQERGLHPTQKPVNLMAWLIRTYSNPGEVVLDPTMGSGTTGIAALNEGRRFIGIEKDEAHFLTTKSRFAASFPDLGIGPNPIEKRKAAHYSKKNDNPSWLEGASHV